jgi:hypothetical protein
MEKNAATNGTIRIRARSARVKKIYVSKEDEDIIICLKRIAGDLRNAHENFDNADEEALVDSYIYEIMALNRRYDYYVKQCKSRGLMADLF